MRSFETRIEQLLERPRFSDVARWLASGFDAVQTSAPRLASLFSTQQRWLMSHVALSRYFRGLEAGRPALTRLDFLEDVTAHRLASRNTAAAFFAEALHYGIVRPCAGEPGLAGFAEPAPETLSALGVWHQLHLGALDMLDGGGRAAALLADGRLTAKIEPRISDGLMACALFRALPPVYAAFACVDDGGSLMDRLILGLDPAQGDIEQAPTNVTSISALARRLNLSRTHAGRTLAAAAACGGLGWSGTPGRSPIWLSRSFRDQYAQVQAAKLAIVDAAFEEAIADRAPSPAFPPPAAMGPEAPESLPA